MSKDLITTFATAYDLLPNAICFFRADGSEDLLFANRAALALYACNDRAAFFQHTGGHFRGLMIEDDYQPLERFARHGSHHEHYLTFRCNLPKNHIVRAEGYVKEILHPTFGALYCLILTDMSRRSESIESDQITQLMGMHAFFRRIDEEAERCLKDGTFTEYCSVYFNITNFRLYNTTHGIRQGDACLRHIAKVLRNQFPGCLIAHISADNFAVLARVENVQETIERASSLIATYISNPNIELKAGIRLFDDVNEYKNTTTSFEEAKLACESIKRDATRIYAVYVPEMGRQLAMKSYVREHFDEALEKGHIQIFYQPVMRTLTGKLCGFEALARWESPTLGRLSPADFIPALEESRLIHRLDTYVVEHVAQHQRKLLQSSQPIVPISFNLSRLDFALMDCPTVVDDIVHRYGLSRNFVHVEVTENALVDNADLIQDGVQRFRELGYEVWLDDFGSGYSSLNVLKDYKFDELKLDMAFLRTFNKASSKIIRSSVCLAKELGMHTLAEGVETAEQVAFLRSIGCEKMQGWYFGKPMPYEECRQMFIEENIESETPSEAFLSASAGLIDITVPTPTAIWRTTPGRVDVLQMNEPYAKTLAQIGIRGTEEASRGLNTMTKPLQERFQSFVKHAIDSRMTETMTYVDQGLYMRLKLQTIASVGQTCVHRAEFYNITADKTARDKESETLDKALRSILLAYEGVYYIQPALDRGDTIVSMASTGWSAGTFRDLGATARSFAEDYIHPADRDRFLSFVQTDNIYELAAASERSLAVAVFRVLRSDGSYTWMKLTCLVLHERAGKPFLMLANRNAFAEQAGFQEFLQLMIESSGFDKHLFDHAQSDRTAPIWAAFLQHTDLKIFWKDKDRRFLGASQAFLDYYGLASIDGVLGKTDEEVGWHIDDHPFQSDEIDVIEKGRVIHGALGQCIIGGMPHNIRASKFPIYENGKIIGLVGYFEDMDDALQREILKRDLSLVDPVTGLMGYRGMIMAGLSYSDNYRLNGEDYTALLIDIPAFDQLHRVLDDSSQARLLKRIATVLTDALPPSGTIAQIGACKFLTLQKGVTDESLHGRIDQITNDLQSIHEVDGFPCTLYPHYASVHGSEAKSLDALLTILGERLKDAEEQEYGPSVYVGDRIAFEREIFDDYDECVFISDPETMTLAYCNKKMLQMLHVPEDTPYQGKHCYEFCYGRGTACDDCPISYLSRSKFHTELTHNDYAGVDLLMRSTLIPWRGKNYLFSLGLDLSDFETLGHRQDALARRELAASDAIRIGMREPDPTSGITKLLTSFGRRFGCDRVLLFEEDPDKIQLSYRWESQSVPPLAEKFTVPRAEVAHFYERFVHKDTYKIRDVSAYWKTHPTDAPHIASLDRLIFSRITLDGKPYGFLEAINPPDRVLDDAAQVLSTLSRFAAILLRNRDLMHDLDRAGKVDQMTGVYNRRGLIEAAEHLIPGAKYALVFFDVNGLKKTNDTQGHKAGDRLIKNTAATLRTIPSSAVFRMGGDEFLLLKRIESEQDIEPLLELLQQRFDHVGVSAALGATVIHAPIDDIDAALTKADELMYDNKKKHYETRHIDQ